MILLTDSILRLLNSILGTSYISRCLITLILAMLPIVELRGAIPIGVGVLGLPIPTAALISLAGNMLPIPFIILFVRKVFAWMRARSAKLGILADTLEKKAKSKGQNLYRGELIGLMIFVAIPLPGTGAWTGALIAAILDIRLKAALPAIGIGVFIACLLITGITFGFQAMLFGV